MRTACSDSVAGADPFDSDFADNSIGNSDPFAGDVDFTEENESSNSEDNRCNEENTNPIPDENIGDGRSVFFAVDDDGNEEDIPSDYSEQSMWDAMNSTENDLDDENFICRRRDQCCH